MIEDIKNSLDDLINSKNRKGRRKGSPPARDPYGKNSKVKVKGGNREQEGDHTRLKIELVGKTR